jgi:hypothetical protein
MFAYEVLTEQAAMAERHQLLEAGVYDGVIASSSDRTSASGNPMMDMTVSVFDKNGKQHDIRDFLVFTRSMMWRVINFAKSAGVMDVYEAGKLCSDAIINKRVKVKVVIEDAKEIPEDKLNGKPSGSKYPEKNRIEDYVLAEEGSELDDDIPFF